MIALDTDHVTVLQTPGGQRRTRLVERMAATGGERFGVSIATVEEQMRGGSRRSHGSDKFHVRSRLTAN